MDLIKKTFCSLIFITIVKKFKKLKLMTKNPKKPGAKGPKVTKKKGRNKGLLTEKEKALKKAQKERLKVMKAYQKTRLYTTIKTGFKKLCRDPQMADVLEDCARRCSVIAIEASMLTSIHLLRLLDSGMALPEFLDDTFFNNCVSAIANLTRKTKHADDSPLYNTLYEHYLPLKPHGYVDVGRVPNVMGQMLVIIAHQARPSSAEFCCKYGDDYLC